MFLWKNRMKRRMNFIDNRFVLTTPPVASLEPSTLKARQFWGPTSFNGGNSFTNSFTFNSWPHSSNNLQDEQEITKSSNLRLIKGIRGILRKRNCRASDQHPLTQTAGKNLNSLYYNIKFHVYVRLHIFIKKITIQQASS